MIPLPTVESGEDYPPLSALNDLLFCPRRCFLHRVEGVWHDNVHTITGTQGHRRVHETRDATEGNLRTARGLRLVSHTMRLQGIADIVEFREGVPFPIEYKQGKRRKWNNDEVQLCAQAICLEEMLGVSTPCGAIFHLKSKRRRDVVFNAKLRELTRTSAAQLHEVLKQVIAPVPIFHKKCQQCSLYSLCMPELLSAPQAYHRSGADLFAAPKTES